MVVVIVKEDKWIHERIHAVITCTVWTKNSFVLMSLFLSNQKPPFLIIFLQYSIHGILFLEGYFCVKIWGQKFVFIFFTISNFDSLCLSARFRKLNKTVIRRKSLFRFKTITPSTDNGIFLSFCRNHGDSREHEVC